MLGRGVTEERWRTIAASTGDGDEEVAQPELVNRIMLRREAYFAYRAEADMWLAEQMGEGFQGTVGSAAISYFGPTDAPGNCWCVVAEKMEEAE